MSKLNKHNTLSFIVLTLVALAAFVLATIALYVSQRPDQALQATIQDMRYQHGRLSFCYEQKIESCNDASIEAWNSENPDDKFHILGSSL